MRLSNVTSLASVCDSDDLFIKPPNSTWNSRAWLARLCEIDESQIVAEVMRMPAAYKVAMIVSHLNCICFLETHHVSIDEYILVNYCHCVNIISPFKWQHVQ